MVAIAQLAERQIVVLNVVGSNPTSHPFYMEYGIRCGLRNLTVNQGLQLRLSGFDSRHTPHKSLPPFG